MIASAKTGADGGFNLKIKAAIWSLKNQVVLSPIGGKGHDATVEITKQNKYSVMGMEWSGQTGDFLAKGAGRAERFRPPFGRFANASDQGRLLHKAGAASEDYADVVLDLTQLESTVEYFTALVGLDDFARFDLCVIGRKR